jgi:hypothetical protein
MAGFPTTKADIDARIGGVVVTLRDTLESAKRIDDWLDAVTDEELTAKGYSSDEVATIKSAFNSLVVLRNVANGQATVANADDFFFFARKLTGLL